MSFAERSLSAWAGGNYSLAKFLLSNHIVGNPNWVNQLMALDPPKQFMSMIRIIKNPDGTPGVILKDVAS